MTANHIQLTTAQVILQQLGGNKFIAMTGSKNFVDCGNALSMRLSRNKIGAQFLKVELNSMDTYDMVFSKSKKVMDPKYGFKTDTLVVIEKVTGVYDDMLQNVFTKHTGLYTSMGTMGK